MGTHFSKGFTEIIRQKGIQNWKQNQQEFQLATIDFGELIYPFSNMLRCG